MVVQTQVNERIEIWDGGECSAVLDGVVERALVGCHERRSRLASCMVYLQKNPRRR